MRTTILFSYKNRTTRYGIHKDDLNILWKDTYSEDLSLGKYGNRVIDNTYNYKGRKSNTNLRY